METHDPAGGDLYELAKTSIEEARVAKDPIFTYRRMNPHGWGQTVYVGDDQHPFDAKDFLEQLPEILRGEITRLLLQSINERLEAIRERLDKLEGQK